MQQPHKAYYRKQYQYPYRHRHPVNRSKPDYPMMLSQVGRFLWDSQASVVDRTIICVTRDVEQDRQNLPLQNVEHILPTFRQLYSQL